MASIDRTAYPRFKRVVSARELAEAFTPTSGEIGWARGKTQSDEHCLALVLRLKSYQRLGYFPKLDAVPAVVIEHVRAAIGLPEDVDAETDADRTAKRHREFVRKYLGVKYESAKVRAVAEKAIREAVQTKDNPADLINVALEELVRASCELPGYTTLDAMTATIRTEVNGRFHAMVAARPDRAARAGLDRLLLVDPATRRSDFGRIKTPAKAPTLGKFKQRLAHLQELDALGPTESWLQGVPPGKIAHFAGEAKMAGVDDMRKCGDAKRVTLLISLVHQQRIEARDEVVTMFCKRMAAIHKKGKERLEELREVHRAESERLIGVFGEVLAGTREATGPSGVDSDGQTPAAPRDPASGTPDEIAQRAGRLLLKTLESAGGLEETTDRGVESVTGERRERPPDRGRVRRADSHPVQGVLDRVIGPFGDRGERTRTGEHRAHRHEQDRREPMPYTPFLAWVRHRFQHLQQATSRVRRHLAQRGELA